MTLVRNANERAVKEYLRLTLSFAFVIDVIYLFQIYTVHSPPIFPWDCRAIVYFDRAVAILVCISERDLGRVCELPRGAGVGRGREKFFRSPTQLAPLSSSGSSGTLSRSRSIEAYQSRQSHGEIGGL